jgi:hypothetical protein
MVMPGRRTGPGPTAVATAFAWLAPLIAGVIALELGRRALMPGVGFWDTAELQTVGPVLGTAHPTGIPAYVILGWIANVALAPFGEPAFRMNLLSAICVAVGVAISVVLVRRLTGSAIIGLAAGIGLAATPIVWDIATAADAHALHLVLVAALLLALVAWEQARRRRDPSRADRWLVAAAAIYGVSLANHQLTLLLAPAIAVYVIVVEPGLRRRLRFVGGCAAVMLGTAALLYLELPLRAGPFRAPLVYGSPDTLDGFLYIVLAEQFRGSFANPLADLPGTVGEVLSLATAQFGALTVIVPIAFLVTALRRPPYALLSGVAFGVTVLFAAVYTNADIGRYYLGPILVAWTWLAVFAAAVVEAFVVLLGTPAVDGGEVADPAMAARGAGQRASIVGVVGAIVAAGLLLVPTAFDLDRRAAEVDRGGEVAAAAWTDAMLAGLEPDAVVVSWWSYSTPLWYAQIVEGRRPDIWIVDDRTRLDEDLGDAFDVIDDNLGVRPVYAIRFHQTEIDVLKTAYIVEPLPAPAHNVLHVVGRREIGGEETARP